MALPEVELAPELLGPEGPFVEVLEGFEWRSGQQEMAAAVARALQEDGLSFIEAGTGTGKSLAYLVPAALFAVHSGQRVVISTNTINLQEQLLHKDIPLVKEALLPNLRACLVKGWSNYLCLYRFQAVSAQGVLDMGWEDPIGDIADWVRVASEGSLSELGQEPAIWHEICAESDTCLRGDCPYYRRCFLFRARAQVEEAHLLVVNHHLLLADVAIRRAIGWDSDYSALPNYRYLIADEAHHIERVATDFLSTTLSEYALSRFLGRLYRRSGVSRGVLAQVVGAANEWLLAGRESEQMDSILRLIEYTAYPLLMGVERAGRSCFEAVGLWLGDRSARRVVDLPSWQGEVGAELTELAEALTGLAKCLDELRSKANTLLADEPGALKELEALTGRGSALAAIARQLAIAEAEEEVYWVDKKGGRRQQVRLVVTPLEAAPALQEWVEHLTTAVYTSATLTVGNSFTYMRSRLGLTELDAAELVISSPFSYREQALLCIPGDLPEPNDRDYLDALSSAVGRLVEASRGRALVLFTSYRALDFVAERLRPICEKEGWPLLVQGEQGRSQMLAAFREDNSVLLGTDSFWEGVDVPGQALSCLILTRLPFRVPDEPVAEARHEALRRRGYDPFYNYSMPEAVLKFKQGFGRLIRSHRDRGVVVVCDRRILSRQYGRWFLASLPECASWRGSLSEVVSLVREWV